jgi:TRAP-type C4-dicarboxylate transport system permease small subunit
VNLTLTARGPRSGPLCSPIAHAACVRARGVRLSTACAAIAAVMLLIAALVITWSVIYRAMGASTYWEIEFSVYMMVASLFLASPYCLATQGHVGVDLLSHYLPRSLARPLASWSASSGWRCASTSPGRAPS